MKAFIIGAVAVVAAIGVTAVAAVNCSQWDTVRGTLTDRYGESKVVGGIMRNVIAVQWWLNADTGSWTVLGLSPENKSACILAAGSHGHLFDLKDAGTDL